MALADTLITLGVLFGLFIIIYSRVKNQSLGETFKEIKSIFPKKEVE